MPVLRLFAASNTDAYDFLECVKVVFVQLAEEREEGALSVLWWWVLGL